MTRLLDLTGQEVTLPDERRAVEIDGQVYVADGNDVYCLEPGDAGGCLECMGSGYTHRVDRVLDHTNSILCGPGQPPFNGNSNYFCLECALAHSILVKEQEFDMYPGATMEVLTSVDHPPQFESLKSPGRFADVGAWLRTDPVIRARFIVDCFNASVKPGEDYRILVAVHDGNGDRTQFKRRLVGYEAD